jgi:hypothetical protein
LCLPDPVKCWSRLPKASSGTILRSTGRPECVTARAPASPEVETLSIPPRPANASTSAAGSLAATTMSRSFTVSARRRALPASSTRSADGWSRRLATSSSPTARAFESSMRALGRPSAPAASAASTFSSAFVPKPFTSFSWPVSAALRRSSIELTPIWSWSSLARLGPRPGMRVTSTSPDGMRCLSLSAEGMLPVSSRASIFSAIVLPTPASSTARPCFAISATETPASRIAFAALR